METIQNQSIIISTFGAISRAFSGTLVFLLKKIRLIKNGDFLIVETMESDAPYNYRLDCSPKQPICVSLFVKGAVPLKRFLDPSDKKAFLAWFFEEGTHVTIPGIATQTPCRNGSLQVKLYKSLPYYYEFTGDDGKEYFYKGAKNLRDLNQFRAWSTLYGGVFDKETGKQVLESTTFFGQTQYIRKFVKFVFSLKLR